jgi:hypothetical protein
MFRTKYIVNSLAEKKRNFYWKLSKLLKIENRWVTVTTAQQMMYFAHLFLNYWKFKRINLKLPNLIFENK